MSDLQSKTPITDAAEKASAESIKNEAYRSEGRAKHSNNGWKHARALELAANAMADVMRELRPECYGFHHSRGDRHAAGDPCPLVKRYNKALAAFATLTQHEQ